jgi:phosphotransferase system enzyme I (PtsI)
VSSTVLDGSPASEGIAWGRVRLVHWEVPEAPHHMVEPDQVEAEVQRFHEARDWGRVRLEALKAATEARVGTVEARIFDPQLLMLDDIDLVEGTERYIRENRLIAARAFDWRMMELQTRWSRTSNPMVLDRLNDLEDLQVRLLHRLLDLPDPFDTESGNADAVIVARNLTPSLTVQLDPERIRAVATDFGTRTAHWVILARSMGIPAVVGLGDISKRACEDQEIIVDGRIGRVVLDPDERDRSVFEERRSRIRMWEDEVEAIAGLESVTADGQPIALRANLDLPMEAASARRHGAQGVGLFRTEFLVMGRASMPDEDEQYEAYRQVAETFEGEAVYIRLFDLGGDKFPMFLHMPPEENPFLGWRAVRVLLDQPELLRTQLRAILRASVHGDVRIMVPLVNDVEEIVRVRELLDEEENLLRRDGVAFNQGYKLGVMIETPAAALDAAKLARHSDFFSIGTNDLVQYTLAVDRTNARLARLYNPFHPAVVRQLHMVSRVARAAGIEVSVCGEMAASVLGAFLLLGLDITALSLAWQALPELKKVLREIRIEDARNAAQYALAAPTPRDVMECLAEGIGDRVDLAAYQGRWSFSVRR